MSVLKARFGTEPWDYDNPIHSIKEVSALSGINICYVSKYLKQFTDEYANKQPFDRENLQKDKRAQQQFIQDRSTLLRNDPQYYKRLN